MKLLNLSLSTPLAEKPVNGFNDPQLHQIAYSQFFEKMVYVVKTPDEPAYTEFDLTDKIRIIPTRTPGRLSYMKAAMRLGAAAVRAHGCDVIAAQEPFGTGPVGYLLARRFGLPLCVHNVSDFIDNPYWLAEEPANRLLNPVGKFILRKSRAVRVDSGDEAKKMLRLGIPASRVHNIQFIINEADNFMNADGAALRENLLGGRFSQIVLFTARFEPQKDFETLFRVIKIVIKDNPGILFVVAGSGKRDAEYRAMADNMGISANIVFPGWVDYFDLPRYYAAADSFLLTSVHETNPRALIFARLAKKAVVTTDISGAGGLVAHGQTGFIHARRDAPALAASILSLAQNPELRRDMGIKGFDAVQSILDKEFILNQVREMYEGICKGFSQSRARQ